MAILLLFTSLAAGCAPKQDLDRQAETITKPYRFSIVKWELNAFGEWAGKTFYNRQKRTDGGTREVAQYFSTVERIKKLESSIGAVKSGKGQGDLARLEAELNRLQQQSTAVADIVESILETQIRDTLTQQGIFNPIIGLRVSFPPVNFKLGKPPYLLVVSPRERIESIREITLIPSLSLEEMEDIEARVDKLGVSSLVVGLGGLGAIYPSLVSREAGLPSTIDTITEEWLHQYLAFKPLGFLYLLDLTGLSRNYEIATMNETLVGMVSKEIGSMVYEKYYAEYENGASQTRAAGAESDFDRQMREIRKTVDVYLVQGEIERAEEFMEDKRQYLASKGYHIRKLNQAYFAFHGTYADKPAFLSPIGLELKELRAQSASLKDFLNTVATMTSRQDLRDSIESGG